MGLLLLLDLLLVVVGGVRDSMVSCCWCGTFCSSVKSLVVSRIFESLLVLALMSWAILMDSSRDTA